MRMVVKSGGFAMGMFVPMPGVVEVGMGVRALADEVCPQQKIEIGEDDLRLPIGGDAVLLGYDDYPRRYFIHHG